MKEKPRNVKDEIHTMVRNYLLVNGWFGEWSAWSSCSVTCGDGHMAQTRVCHPPLHGGLPCSNRLSKTKLCNLRSCAGKSLDYCIRFAKRIITLSILVIF